MTSRPEAAAALEQRLGHAFREPRLLRQALTHASVAEGDPRGPADNQRLEFLGDRVLGLAIAAALFARHGDADEGALSQRLHSLVDKSACARVAESLGLGEALRLSAAETRTGGRRKEGILADAMEAVIAAVYLDGGFEAARALVERAWADELARAPQAGAVMNPKSALQEWSQARSLDIPVYEVIARDGPDHAPRFVVEARIRTLEPARGEGGSRQAAEKDAALNLLRREGQL
ncbi:MAG: ribonuclease III [Brevundimonas sp.]|jgi:ribonuclease III|uniref:ribonuclease III n=1 Tax=Brevundimonas sp. TaxID=1871086 RepID=UPI0039193739